MTAESTNKHKNMFSTVLDHLAADVEHVSVSPSSQSAENERRTAQWNLNGSCAQAADET